LLLLFLLRDRQEGFDGFLIDMSDVVLDGLYQDVNGPGAIAGVEVVVTCLYPSRQYIAKAVE
jgi:hypothetical protein